MQKPKNYELFRTDNAIGLRLFYRGEPFAIGHAQKAVKFQRFFGALELPGFAFKRVDKIARKMGAPKGGARS